MPIRARIDRGRRAGLLTLCAALAAAGCASSPTTLLLSVQLDPNSPAPTSLSVSVFDVHHALALGGAVPSVKLPGTLLIIDLPASDQPLRIAVDSDAASAEEGFATVTTASGARVQAATTLSRVTIDTDHDGVPDAIDNCPDVSNSDQADKLGNGRGDACRSTTDSGVPSDLAGDDLAVSTGDMAGDMAPPPVLECNAAFCEDFENGSWDPSWYVEHDSQATETVDAVHSFSGRYALHVHVNAISKNGYYLQTGLHTNHDLAQTGGFLRTWIFLATRAPNQTSLFTASQVNSEPYGAVEVGVDDQLLETSSGGLTPEVFEKSGPAIPIGRWVCLEWELQVDPSTSDGGLIPNGMSLWLTDPKTSTTPQLIITNNGPHAPNGVLGWGPELAFSAFNQQAWDLWYDAIAVNSTRIGCY